MISIPTSRVVVSRKENRAFADGTGLDEILARAAALHVLFAGRAATHDRDADFPFDDIADFSASGLMALPNRVDAGGLGGSLAAAQRVCRQSRARRPISRVGDRKSLYGPCDDRGTGRLARGTGSQA